MKTILITSLVLIMGCGSSAPGEPDTVKETHTEVVVNHDYEPYPQVSPSPCMCPHHPKGKE